MNGSGPAPSHQIQREHDAAENRYESSKSTSFSANAPTKGPVGLTEPPGEMRKNQRCKRHWFLFPWAVDYRRIGRENPDEPCQNTCPQEKRNHRIQRTQARRRRDNLSSGREFQRFSIVRVGQDHLAIPTVDDRG